MMGERERERRWEKSWSSEKKERKKTNQEWQEIKFKWVSLCGEEEILREEIEGGNENWERKRERLHISKLSILGYSKKHEKKTNLR